METIKVNPKNDKQVLVCEERVEPRYYGVREYLICSIVNYMVDYLSDYLVYIKDKDYKYLNNVDGDYNSLEDFKSMYEEYTDFYYINVFNFFDKKIVKFTKHCTSNTIGYIGISEEDNRFYYYKDVERRLSSYLNKDMEEWLVFDKLDDTLKEMHIVQKDFEDMVEEARYFNNVYGVDFSKIELE